MHRCQRQEDPAMPQACILDNHVVQNAAFAPKCHLTSDLHMAQCCQIGKSYTHAHPSRHANAFVASASKHYDAKHAQQRKKISHQSAKAHAVYMIAAQRRAQSERTVRTAFCARPISSVWAMQHVLGVSRGSHQNTGGSHQTFSLQSMCC